MTDKNTLKEPTKFIPASEELSFDLHKSPNIENSFYIVHHFFKCIIIAAVIFILLEKISKTYNILHVETNNEEESIDVVEPRFTKKENLTFYCDENVETENKTEAILLLKEDIINLKHLIIKLGEQLRERRRFECIARNELSKIEDRVRKELAESDTVDKKIKNALYAYEADKVALFDYAASYAGGNVVDIFDAIPAPSNKISRMLWVFKLSKNSSPTQIISPSCLPGDCFTFFGNKAKIIIQLGKSIHVGSVSLEHSFLVEDISSAPREFQVYGLETVDEASKDFLGNFTYEVAKKQSLQTFQISSKMANTKQYGYVMLEIMNNHGHEEFTSIYRFRVHSK